MGMQEWGKLKTLYDKLLLNIRNCIKEIPYEQFRDIKKLVIIATNEEGQLTKLIRTLCKINPDMEILFIAQPKMAKILPEFINDKMSIYEWQGLYTMQMADYIISNINGSKLDGFLYFCDQPINLRNNNLMNIAENLWNKLNIRVFSVNMEEEAFFEYHNIEMYNCGVGLYEKANRFIDLCLKASNGMRM